MPMEIRGAERMSMKSRKSKSAMIHGGQDGREVRERVGRQKVPSRTKKKRN